MALELLVWRGPWLGGLGADWISRVAVLVGARLPDEAKPLHEMSKLAKDLEGIMDDQMAFAVRILVIRTEYLLSYDN